MPFFAHGLRTLFQACVTLPAPLFDPRFCPRFWSAGVLSTTAIVASLGLTVYKVATRTELSGGEEDWTAISYEGRALVRPSVEKAKLSRLHLAPCEGSLVFVMLLILLWAISNGITLGRDA